MWPEPRCLNVWLAICAGERLGLDGVTQVIFNLLAAQHKSLGKRPILLSALESVGNLEGVQALDHACIKLGGIWRFVLVEHSYQQVESPLTVWEFLLADLNEDLNGVLRLTSVLGDRVGATIQAEGVSNTVIQTNDIYNGCKST